MIMQTRVTIVASHLTKTKTTLPERQNTTQTLGPKVHHEKNNTEGIHSD